ncbi:MAG: SDR family NAD(P)-dependent oxidoreductase [Acidimicrobiia bacterium]|nr:SDR family NAD(P)-dependent oxidoreductase [Acidimicrobiia bacterium]
MNNALSQPQTIVVLGGGSDIARAIVRALATPALRTVVLAVRSPSGESDLELPDDIDSAGVEVVEVAFDATHHDGHATFVGELSDRFGDLDIVIQAFGQLGNDAADDPAAAARLADVNFTGAVSSGLAVAGQLRTQGHGTLIVLSSVAGIRTRPSNFVYGATKAGQDAFSTGLAHALHGSGASVMTVRPGFIRSKMTAGMDDAPFATDPDAVAAAVAAGLHRRRSVVWVPGVLAVVFGIMRYLPGSVWRRLDR